MILTGLGGANMGDNKRPGGFPVPFLACRGVPALYDAEKENINIDLKYK